MSEHFVVTSGWTPPPVVSFYIYCSCGWGHLSNTMRYDAVTRVKRGVEAFREHLTADGKGTPNE